MPNSNRTRIGANDRDSFIRLMESLESFRDVALAQYALTDPGQARTAFADRVSVAVRAFTGQLAAVEKPNWDSFKRNHPDEVPAATVTAADAMAANATAADCPPGFIKNSQGECVPIEGPRTP